MKRRVATRIRPLSSNAVTPWKWASKIWSKSRDSWSYYGLSTLDLTRIAAAARAGQNALNGARNDAITRKKH
jgi:hypothetical protein